MTMWDDTSGQVIFIAGITITIAILAFATIYYSAGMAGQRTIREEQGDLSFVFNDVRNTYGHVLRDVSSNGEEDPFNGTNRDMMHIYETQIERVVNRRGYFLVFENSSKSYDSSPPTANVTIRLSDGMSVYSDAVGYDLRTGETR
jgi:hypothetical protein